MSDKYGVFRTIPAWDLLNERLFKDNVMEEFDKFLKKQFEYPYHIREIEERDFSLDDWRLPVGERNSWCGTEWVQHLLSCHEAVCIYGVVSLSEQLSARKLIFGRGAHMITITARQDLTALKSFETALKAIRDCEDQEWLKETFRTVEDLRMDGYFQQPIIFLPREFVSIGIISFPGIDPGELKLMGYVAETVGKSIA